MTCYFTEEEYARLVIAAQMAGTPLYAVVAKVVGEFLKNNRPAIDDALRILRPENLDFGK